VERARFRVRAPVPGQHSGTDTDTGTGRAWLFEEQPSRHNRVGRTVYRLSSSIIASISSWKAWMMDSGSGTSPESVATPRRTWPA